MGHIQHSIIEAVLLQSSGQPCDLVVGESHADDRPFASLCLVYGHAGNHVRLAHAAGQGEQSALLDDFSFSRRAASWRGLPSARRAFLSAVIAAVAACGFPARVFLALIRERLRRPEVGPVRGRAALPLRGRRLRIVQSVPMRGLKQLRSARVICAAHAFIKNLRRGYYELANRR